MKQDAAPVIDNSRDRSLSAAYEAGPDLSPQYSARYVWYVVVLLSIVNVFNYMDRMAVSVLAPSIKSDLHLSDTQLGLLIGFAFSAFYAICGIPIARWADRGIRRNLIAAALAVWSVMTALNGTAQSFWHLLLARIGVGAGEAGSIPASQSLICDYVPLKRRPGIFAVHNFGLIVGMMLGMTLSGLLVQIVGWRWVFILLGLPGLLLAIVVRLTLREPPRGVIDGLTDDRAATSIGVTAKALWDCRTYRLLIAVVVINGFVQFGLNQWWPTFFARTFHLGIASVGIQLGLALGLGSGIGMLAGGLLANSIGRRDVRLPLFVGAAATFLALPAAIGSLFATSVTTSVIFVGLTGALWSISNGPIVASALSVVRSRTRATAGAIKNFLTSLIGYGLGPFCVGYLSDHLAPSLGTMSLRYALLAPASLIPVMAIALYAAAKRLPGDLRAVEIEPSSPANSMHAAAATPR